MVASKAGVAAGIENPTGRLHQDSRENSFALDLDLGVGIDQGRDLDQRHRREVPAERAGPRRADRGAGGVELGDVRDVGAQCHQVARLAARGLQDGHEVAQRHPPLRAGIGAWDDMSLSGLAADLAGDAHAPRAGGDDGVRESARPRPALRQDRRIGDIGWGHDRRLLLLNSSIEYKLAPNSEDAAMRDPRALIDTATLAASLGDPSLRVFDCTTYLEPTPAGSAEPYIAVPGRKTFEEGHVPGADFLDLQGEFSDTGTHLHFMMPPVGRLEAAFGRHGVGPGARVVLYSVGTMMWATRLWWMLRSLGFDDAAVLDGGLDKWRAESRPVESGPAKGYPAAPFKAAPRPGLFVDKDSVSAALSDRATVIVNALGPQFHQGLEPSRYGRPGRIPGSVNVPAAQLVDAQRKDFVPLTDAAAKFERQGIRKDKRVVCYCGGGISATIDLFLLHQLGYDNLTLYDGSMGEWAKDTSLPIETDAKP